MSSATLSRPADIPSHVPPELVFDFDLYNLPGGESDFHAPWKHLQDTAERGLVWTPCNGGHWIVTKAKEIARIYEDSENFSSSVLIVPREWGEGFRLRPTTLDPPEHRPFRRRINAGITPKIVRGLQPKVRELAISLIEKFRLRGSCEFITEFAEIMPVSIFMLLADLPMEDAPGLRPYAKQLIRPDGSMTITEIMDKFADYLRPFVRARRETPGDDLISQIAAGVIDEQLLTEDEAVEASCVVLFGGLDTVVSFLGFMMIFLARNPGHRRQLLEKPSLMPSAIFEILRRFPIVVKARLIKSDQLIEGVPVKAGEIVVLPPLGGLDEQEFDDPLKVDFERRTALNTTFGSGIHRCPGSVLAHSELETTMREWLLRIPDFEIDPARPPVMVGGFLGAVASVGFRWDPAATTEVTA